MAISTIGSNGNSPPTPVAVPQGSNPAPEVKTAPAASAPPPRQPSHEQVQKTIESIRQAVRPTPANSLQFSIDDTTGKTIVRISDAETGEMIRQIPSEELLEIARSLDKLQGLMLKDKA